MVHLPLWAGDNSQQSDLVVLRRAWPSLEYNFPNPLCPLDSPTRWFPCLSLLGFPCLPSSHCLRLLGLPCLLSCPCLRLMCPPYILGIFYLRQLGPPCLLAPPGLYLLGPTCLLDPPKCSSWYPAPHCYFNLWARYPSVPFTPVYLVAAGLLSFS